MPAPAPAQLSARPLVPSSLSDIVRRFSPGYAAAQEAAAKGRLTMAEKLSLKKGGCTHACVRACERACGNVWVGVSLGLGRRGGGGSG